MQMCFNEFLWQSVFYLIWGSYFSHLTSLKLWCILHSVLRIMNGIVFFSVVCKVSAHFPFSDVLDYVALCYNNKSLGNHGDLKSPRVMLLVQSQTESSVTLQGSRVSCDILVPSSWALTPSLFSEKGDPGVSHQQLDAPAWQWRMFLLPPIHWPRLIAWICTTPKEARKFKSHPSLTKGRWTRYGWACSVSYYKSTETWCLGCIGIYIRNPFKTHMQWLACDLSQSFQNILSKDVSLHRTKPLRKSEKDGIIK